MVSPQPQRAFFENIFTFDLDPPLIGRTKFSLSFPLSDATSINPAFNELPLIKAPAVRVFENESW